MKLFLSVAISIALCGAWLPSPPDHLWIKGQYWRVKYPATMSVPTPIGMYPLAGNTDCTTRTISIARDDDPKNWPDTLLHEAAHAYTCGDDLDVHNDLFNSPPDGAHPGIEQVAAFGVRFIKENPRVARWMQR